MKITVVFDTDTKDILASVEENGQHKPLPDVSSVNFSKTGYSVWQRDKLVASLGPNPDKNLGAALIERFTIHDPKEPFVVDTAIAANKSKPAENDKVRQGILDYFGVPPTQLQNQPEPIATIKLANVDPKKTRADIERYFAAGED